MSGHERRVELPRQVIRCCDVCGQPIDHFEEMLELDGVRIAGNLVSYAGQSRSLRRGAVILLRLLMLRGRLSSEAYLIAVNSEAGVSTVRTYACWLRAALRQIHAPIEIRTIKTWGLELVREA